MLSLWKFHQNPSTYEVSQKDNTKVQNVTTFDSHITDISIVIENIVKSYTSIANMKKIEVGEDSKWSGVQNFGRVVVPNQSGSVLESILIGCIATKSAG